MAAFLDFLFRPAGDMPGWLVGTLFLLALVAIVLLVRRSLRRVRPLKGGPVPRPLMTPPDAPGRKDLSKKLATEQGLLSTGGGNALKSAERMGRVSALAEALGRRDDAILHRQAAVRRFRENEGEPMGIEAQIAIGRFCLDQHLWEDAAFWFERAQREAERGRDPGLLAQAAGGVALVYYWRGDYRDALSRLMVAQLALGERGYDRPRAAFHEIKGAVEASLGRIDAARQDYRRAARLYRSLGQADQAAPVHRATGDLYHHAGDIPGACAEWALARDLYAKTGDIENARTLDTLIQRYTHRSP